MISNKCNYNVFLPGEIAEENGLSLLRYQDAARCTDRMAPRTDLTMPILGLFGEIGSLLTVLKKKRREGPAYADYDSAIIEEFGDVLWYLSTITSRAGLDLSVLAQRVSRELLDWDQAQSSDELKFEDIQPLKSLGSEYDVTEVMTELAGRVGDLVEAHRIGKLLTNRDALSGHLVSILRVLIHSSVVANISLAVAARNNLEKIFSRWPIERRYPQPEVADSELPPNERLPRRFRHLYQRAYSKRKDVCAAKVEWCDHR